MSLDASEFFIRINDHGPELVDTNRFFVLPPPPLGVQNSPPILELDRYCEDKPKRQANKKNPEGKDKGEGSL